jgi:CysZ protein
MLDAAVKAIAQMFSPPLRALLWKSIALALVLIIVVAAALYRLIVWLVGAGSNSAETTFGPYAHWPVEVIAWLLSIAAGLGIVVGSVMLMPAVTALVASFFSDQIADEVERANYPADPPGMALPLWRAIYEGLKTALVAVIVYVCAAPFLLVAGLGVAIFFLATAWLLGREYFELAAMRFEPPAEAKALCKRNATTVYVGGLLIALFVSIPIVNLATPLFAMALMVHLHKRLSAKKLIGRNL